MVYRPPHPSPFPADVALEVVARREDLGDGYRTAPPAHEHRCSSPPASVSSSLPFCARLSRPQTTLYGQGPSARSAYSKETYTTAGGKELNFRDSYKYNIAAYRLDRLLNLHMIPVSVKRKIKGKKAAVTWWVDRVQMMERARYEQKIKAPNLAQWNDQMYQVRIFNELVYNTDPNPGNLLITEDWKLVMIDFSRAFRWHKELRSPENLKNCKLDRRFYDGMRQLSREVVKRLLGDALTNNEIRGGDGPAREDTETLQ